MNNIEIIGKLVKRGNHNGVQYKLSNKCRIEVVLKSYGTGFYIYYPFNKVAPLSTCIIYKDAVDALIDYFELLKVYASYEMALYKSQEAIYEH